MQFITKQNAAIQCIIFKFGSRFFTEGSAPFSSPDKMLFDAFRCFSMLFDAFDCVDAKFEKYVKC